MQARPSEPDARSLRVLLDDGGAQAELGRADRGDVAARAGSDDDDVVRGGEALDVVSLRRAPSGAKTPGL